MAKATKSNAPKARKTNAPKGRSRVKPKKRDYAAEYQRRIAKAKAVGLSVSAGRGHAKQTEVSAFDLQMLRKAARSDYKRSPLRRKAAELVASMANVEHRSIQRPKMNRQEFTWLSNNEIGRKKFVNKFLELKLGNEHQAWTLWFSP